MDEFKKHIQNHLDELDVDMPSSKVWLQIQKEVVPQKKLKIVSLVKYAAAACVIVLAGFGLFVLLQNSPQQSTSSVGNTPPEKIKTSEIPNGLNKTITQPTDNSFKSIVSNSSKKQQRTTEKNIQPKRIQPNLQNNTTDNWQALASVENTFRQVINLQRARINNTPLNAESPSYFKDFSLQMKQMEKDEIQLKKEMRKTGFSDELLDQLINIYQHKLILLKQLQGEINKTNNRYKQNRSPVDTTKTYFLNI
ncbi:MAG: hypothetical protein ACOVNY_01525 [Chitinophagaceae bacterium]